MNAERQDDGLWRAVAALPTVAVDEAHARRVRARCRRLLQRRQQSSGVTVPGRASSPARIVIIGMMPAMRAWHTLWRMISREPQAGSR